MIEPPALIRAGGSKVGRAKSCYWEGAAPPPEDMVLVPAVFMAFIPPVLSAAGAAVVASAVVLVVSVAAGLLQALSPIARALAAPIRSQRFAVLVILSISRGIAPPVNGSATLPFRKK